MWRIQPHVVELLPGLPRLQFGHVTVDVAEYLARADSLHANVRESNADSRPYVEAQCQGTEIEVLCGKHVLMVDEDVELAVSPHGLEHVLDIATIDLGGSLDMRKPRQLTAEELADYDGSVAVRMKYLYGQFYLPDNSFLTKPNIEFGLVHMPWLDYEEHVNFYRLQDTMFLERNHTFNSADAGITFSSLIGGTIDNDYQKRVTKYYPGRYGSVAVGIYNGGGYHASEKNDNKVFEGRLTIRPLPDTLPGLQFSYFGIIGKGNKSTNPDWKVNLGFINFEDEYLTLTGQYYQGKGNQGGSDENEKKGHSVFAEIKPMEKFSIIGRYDHFDPNKDVINDENDRYIVGLAYMLDKPHHNMILIDYDTVKYKQSATKDDKRIQLTLQIKY